MSDEPNPPAFLDERQREAYCVGWNAALSVPRAPTQERVEKDDEGRPYPCGAFVADDRRWFCRLESDHVGDHEWVHHAPEVPAPDTGCSADALRAALESLFPVSEGFTEAFDDLIRLGLIVPVPADDAFREEWGDDEDTMYVWRWSPLAHGAKSPERPTSCISRETAERYALHDQEDGL